MCKSGQHRIRTLPKTRRVRHPKIQIDGGCPFKPMNRSRPSDRSGTYSTICLLTFLFLVPWIATSASARQTGKKSKDDAADLKQIGDEISKAVLSKDVPRLLSFDRTDLSWQDEGALKDPHSALFCYIFDSKCISPRRRSVYEILSMAGRIGIKPIFYRLPQGYREGLLVFYDASKVSDQLLLSKGYLCKESGRTLATWSFKLVNGHWETQTPFFDSETDGPC